MYEVITVKDGRITGRHESTVEITAQTFANSPMYAGHEVMPVPEGADYREDFLLAEYTAEGVLRPLIDRILEGLTEVPDGYEVIDGDLVQTQVPETEAEAPPTLLARVEAAEEAARNSRAEEAQAVRVVFRALAQTDVLTPEQALENRALFDLWQERIGSQATTGEYLRYEDGLYRVQQEHTIQAHYPPSVHTAALYTRVQEPGSGPEAWVQGQSYAKDVEVTHVGGVWLSGVDNNVWEPGSPGVYDNIWKRVRDA